ncbi:MAG: sensor histidine kinase [Verrucomicrobiales bacterium]|nr:sensor histidine kinase [Verrucomicrobiales bacterium]
MHLGNDSSRPAADARIPWRCFHLVGVVGAIGAAFSLSLATWFHRDGQRADEARFYQLGNEIGVDLERRVEAVEELLRDLERLLNREETPSLDTWNEFMNQTSPQWNHPGVLAIGYATNATSPAIMQALGDWLGPTPRRQRDEFYTLPEGFAGDKSWRVWLLDVYGDGHRPAESYDDEFTETDRLTGAVRRQRFSQPTVDWERKANPFSLFDVDGRPRLAADESGSQPLLNAVYRDDVKVAGRQPLVRRSDRRAVPGVTMLVPTYHPRRGEFRAALVPDPDWAMEDRWLRWQLNTGVLFAYLDLAEMLNQACGPGDRAVRVEIHGGTNLTSKAEWLNPDGEPMRAGDPAFKPAFAHLHEWPMYGDSWRLYFHTTPVFDAQSLRYRAWWAAGWGLLTTALVCWVLALQIWGRLKESRQAAELREARDALRGVQRERERLSHDLHDGAIQSLYAVQLGLTRAAGEVLSHLPETGRRLAGSRASLDAVIGELRQFLARLRAVEPTRDSCGLAAVLDSTVRRLQPASTARIDLCCDRALSDRLDPVQAVHLASFAREALSNSLRHARAGRITVRLTGGESGLVLEVRDDGCGIVAGTLPGGGLGMETMRRRAALLHGHFECESNPGEGTTVRLIAPLCNGDGLSVRAEGAPDEPVGWRMNLAASSGAGNRE